MPSLRMPFRRGRSRWIALALLVALVAAAAAAVLTARGTLDVWRGRGDRDGLPPVGSAPETLIGLDAGTATLVRIDLQTGEEKILGEVTVPDAVVDPARSEIVFTGPASEDDPTPVLRRGALEEPEGADALGPGSQPVLSTDGRYVAGPERSGRGRVVMYDLDVTGAQEPTYLLSEDSWELLGWTTGHNLVARRRTTGDLFITGPRDEEGTPVGNVDGENVRLVSPAAPQALVRTNRRLVIESLRSDGEPVRLASGRNAELRGTWSPDGAWIAGVLLEGGETEIVLVDTGDGSAETLADTERALPDFVWSAGERHFASLIPMGPESFQVVICATDRTCEIKAETERPLRLLALI